MSNELVNAGMEVWSSGPSLPPDHWTLGGAGAIIAQESSIVHSGSYSAKLTSGGLVYTYLRQNFAIENGKGVNYYKGKILSVGSWIWSNYVGPYGARIALYVNDGNWTSQTHPGDSTWHYLQIKTGPIPSDTTYIFITLYNLQNPSGGAPAYFDDASITIVDNVNSMLFGVDF